MLPALGMDDRLVRIGALVAANRSVAASSDDAAGIIKCAAKNWTDRGASAATASGAGTLVTAAGIITGRSTNPATKPKSNIASTIKTLLCTMA